MLRFAVIGNPIEHSLSPIIHQQFAKQTGLNLVYEKILGDLDSCQQQIQTFFSQGGTGLNVTLPFKQRAFNLAHEATVRCKQAGASNTLYLRGENLWADNTDGVGLIRDLSRFINPSQKKILILGGGGAARGIVHLLLESKPKSLQLALRSPGKAALLQQEFPNLWCTDFSCIQEGIDIVINATSVSVTGEPLDLPKACFSHKPFCYDLAYDLKQPTAFIQYARNFGCEAQDGLGMLVEQAAEAFFIWNGLEPNTEKVLQCLRP